MNDQDKIFLTTEQAKSLLSDAKEIHTFRNPRGMLIGCDYNRKSLIKLIERVPAEHIEIGGDVCKNMGHGLVIWEADSPLFVEVDKDKLQALEESLTVSK